MNLRYIIIINSFLRNACGIKINDTTYVITGGDDHEKSTYVLTDVEQLSSFTSLSLMNEDRSGHACSTYKDYHGTDVKNFMENYYN